MRLKNHVHAICHLDDLTVHEAKSLVVIEHGIHIFDPIGVDGAIENDPTSLLIRFLVGAEAEYASQDTVRKLL